MIRGTAHHAVHTDIAATHAHGLLRAVSHYYGLLVHGCHRHRSTRRRGRTARAGHMGYLHSHRLATALSADVREGASLRAHIHKSVHACIKYQRARLCCYRHAVTAAPYAHVTPVCIAVGILVVAREEHTVHILHAIGIVHHIAVAWLGFLDGILRGGAVSHYLGLAASIIGHIEQVQAADLWLKTIVEQLFPGMHSVTTRGLRVHDGVVSAAYHIHTLSIRTIARHGYMLLGYLLSAIAVAVDIGLESQRLGKFQHCD